jgi:hypothetical protein
MPPINLASTSLSKEDCILEIPEIQYDKAELFKIYEQVKHHARVKYLPWVETPKEFKKIEDSRGAVIQCGDHEIRNPEYFGKGVNLLDFDYIKKIAERFRFKHPVYPGNVAILIYKENFIFKPHVDGYANSVVMLPIVVSETPSPIDFYHQPNMVFEQYKEYDGIPDDSLIYSHQYSDNYATIFNSHVIHGVKPTTGFQVRLKININEPFESVREKYKNGELVTML